MALEKLHQVKKSDHLAELCSHQNKLFDELPLLKVLTSSQEGKEVLRKLEASLFKLNANTALLYLSTLRYTLHGYRADLASLSPAVADSFRRYTAPWEQCLESFIAPLDAVYLDRATAVILLAEQGFAQVSRKTREECIRRLNVSGSPESYRSLHQALMKLSSEVSHPYAADDASEISPDYLRRALRNHANFLEALNALEVQYLLSGYALTHEDRGVSHAP